MSISGRLDRIEKQLPPSGAELLRRLELMTDEQSEEWLQSATEQELEAIDATDPETTAYLKTLSDDELEALKAELRAAK